MGLRRRLDALPAELVPAWQAFVDCALLVEGGRRTLLGTMPVGRVEPTPVGLGVEAMGLALDDAGERMAHWQVEPLVDDWQDCVAAMEEARENLTVVGEVAASTSELEELQAAVGGVIQPLDAFADAERTWRRTWRIPRDL